jgi:hypothetical protein
LFTKSVPNRRSAKDNKTSIQRIIFWGKRVTEFYPNKKDQNGEEDSVFRDYLDSKGIIHIQSIHHNIYNIDKNFL